MRARLALVIRAVLLLAAASAVLAGCAALRNGTPTSAAAGSSDAAAPPQASPSGSAAVAGDPATADGASNAALPRPAVGVNPCARNTHAQLVKVSLREQRLWMCVHSTTVYTTAITSGMTTVADDKTPTGNFHIQGRNRNSVLTLNTGQQYTVKYWIPFSAPLYGFHDSSWQKFPYGSPLYKTQGSHGCIHMPLKAIAYLYHWAHVGTSVSITST